MKPRLKSTRTARDLIKAHEPFLGVAERRGRRWLVGYGHSAAAKEGVTLSRENAELLLIYDVLLAEQAVETAAGADLPAPMRDALVSFAASVGANAFKVSDVARLTRAGKHREAAAALETWVRAEEDGRLVVSERLVRRRAAEKALFLSALDAPAAAPEPAPPAQPAPAPRLGPLVEVDIAFEDGPAEAAPAADAAPACADTVNGSEAVAASEEAASQGHDRSAPAPEPESLQEPAPEPAAQQAARTEQDAAVKAVLARMAASMAGDASKASVVAAPAANAPEAHAEAEVAAEAEGEIEARPEPQPEDEIAVAAEPEAEPAAHPALQPDPETVVEAEPELATEPEAEPQPQTEPVAPAHAPGPDMAPRPANWPASANPILGFNFLTPAVVTAPQNPAQPMSESVEAAAPRPVEADAPVSAPGHPHAAQTIAVDAPVTTLEQRVAPQPASLEGALVEGAVPRPAGSGADLAPPHPGDAPARAAGLSGEVEGPRRPEGEPADAVHEDDAALDPAHLAGAEAMAHMPDEGAQSQPQHAGIKLFIGNLGLGLLMTGLGASYLVSNFDAYRAEGIGHDWIAPALIAGGVLMAVASGVTIAGRLKERRAKRN
ncbi:MAG: glycoside hydrolase family protein [Alphaproteobacteria bacterium]|nr:glycoside hydrolase family protein [Alphaproteobacteria bacterium]